MNTSKTGSRYCCAALEQVLTHTCDQHPDPYDCPDSILVYLPKFDEVLIVIHDGGRSGVRIRFCPWCGTRLPESKRDRWFSELESLGFEPESDGIPARYHTDEWHRTGGS